VDSSDNAEKQPVRRQTATKKTTPDNSLDDRSRAAFARQSTTPAAGIAGKTT